MSPYPTLRDWTGERLAKEPLPFRAEVMSLPGRDGLPIYYAQVFAGYGAGTTLPARPIWQSKIRQDIAPRNWPAEARRVAEEAVRVMLERREAYDAGNRG